MAVVYGLEGEGDSSVALRERIRDERRPDGARVYTPLVCLSLMVFFVLACQCASTLAVVRRESGSWSWPAFMFAYQTALAYVGAYVYLAAGQAFAGFQVHFVST